MAVAEAGLEGTGCYGYRLARLLADQGVRVWEISWPDRSRRRRKGKSDPVDAENAARAVLARDVTAIPKDRRGFTAELRLLVATRGSAVKAAPRPPTRSRRSWSRPTTSSAPGCGRCARPASPGRAPPWSPATACTAPWPSWAAAGWR